MSASIALLVGIDAYEDPRLRGLTAPRHDLNALARVLADPLIGDYEVRPPLRNQPMHVVQEEIGNLFADRSPDDRLLLYFSGHGLKSDAGELYLATTNTKLRTTTATAVPSSFVRGEIERSRSRSVILLLDCCYSGAFTRGDLISRAGEHVDVLDQFQGKGRAVITASTAMQYAFELDSDQRSGSSRPSVFTSALVRGLETGEADRDGDGWISVDELYDYLYDEVRRQVPEQTPTASIKVEGKLHIASNRRLATLVGPLPAAIYHDLESPLTKVRERVIRDLADLLGSGDPAVATAARLALEGLEGDDSRRVARLAAEILERHGIAAPSATATPANRPERPTQASGGASPPTTSSANQSPASGTILGPSQQEATGARPSGSASPPLAQFPGQDPTISSAPARNRNSSGRPGQPAESAAPVVPKAATSKQTRKRELERLRARREAERQRARRRRALLPYGTLGLVVVVAALGLWLTSDDDSPGGASTTTATATTSTAAGRSDDARASAPTAPATVACGGEIPSKVDRPTFSKPTTKVDPAKTYEATFQTSCGRFTVLLDPAKAPVTTGNFVFLAGKKFYDSTWFHRIVPGGAAGIAIIQGGDPQGTGMGGPGYAIKDELPDSPAAYKRYSVAMANSGPDSGGSQFFVNFEDNSGGLQPNYSVFGQVTEGTEVIDKIAKVPVGGPQGDTPAQSVWIEKLTVQVS